MRRKGKELKLQGNITISRCLGGDEEARCRPIRIRIEDATSGCVILEASLSPTEYADALFSMAHTPCVVEYYPEVPIGKRREHKTEEVFVKGRGYDDARTKHIRKAIAPYEVDGWVGADEDGLNSNRIIKFLTDGYLVRISFVRYVSDKNSQ